MVIPTLNEQYEKLVASKRMGFLTYVYQTPNNGLELRRIAVDPATDTLSDVYDMTKILEPYDVEVTVDITLT